ncbi:MAG TPA: insulinase family protein, partial [Casimicrobium sp.]|nr:insulinase family protein [Casimicrobium sp.]
IIEAVKLILPQVRAATLDADAFERIKKQRITSLEANAREPQTLINNLAIPYKNKAFGVARGEIHHRLTNAEQIAELRALSFEDVRKAYEQNWGATAVRVSVVGTAPDGLLEEVNKQLVGWTSKAKPYVRYVGKHQPVAGTTLTVEAPDKSNAVIDVDQFLPLNRNHPDSQALGLAVEIFGAGQSDNRLIARIRKKDGLSYHIGAHVSIPEFGDRAYLGIEGTYAPQNRDKVLAALREETELALKDGFTQAELDRARANVLQGRAQGRNNDDAIARALLSQMDTNETFADSAKRDAELKTITLDQVNAAFRKYIKPDEWLIGVAGDFAKAASQTAPK